MSSKAGKVIKKLSPGQPGTARWLQKFGARLVCVRYRGNPTRRVRTTTIEIVVDEKFWMPHHRSLDAMLQSVCPDMDMPLNT